MSELISIIIPVYNVEKYLDKCLESVVHQSYSNLEIILVDDGAVDSSGAKCDEWAKKDSRIQVIHKANGGLSSARNAALEIVTGKYVMFIDSDDIVDTDICSILYDMIIRTKSDVAICGAEHIFGENYCFSRTDEYICFSPENAIVEMWYQKSFLPSAWGKLYKSDLFENRRFTVNRLFEDIDIMHEVFWDASQSVYIKAKLYGYVHREDSITTQKFSKREMDILLIADKILQFVKNKSEKLESAAAAYAIVAALRIYLNAPSISEYQVGISEAKKLLMKYGKKVLKDKNIRKKTRYALLLYFYCRPLIKPIYKRINRWK